MSARIFKKRYFYSKYIHIRFDFLHKINKNKIKTAWSLQICRRSLLTAIHHSNLWMWVNWLLVPYLYLWLRIISKCNDCELLKEDLPVLLFTKHIALALLRISKYDCRFKYFSLDFIICSSIYMLNFLLDIIEFC